MRMKTLSYAFILAVFFSAEYLALLIVHENRFPPVAAIQHTIDRARLVTLR